MPDFERLTTHAWPTPFREDEVCWVLPPRGQQRGQGSGPRTGALPSPPSLGHSKCEAATVPPVGLPKTDTWG